MRWQGAKCVLRDRPAASLLLGLASQLWASWCPWTPCGPCGPCIVPQGLTCRSRWLDSDQYPAACLLEQGCAAWVALPLAFLLGAAAAALAPPFLTAPGASKANAAEGPASSEGDSLDSASLLLLLVLFSLWPDRLRDLAEGLSLEEPAPEKLVSWTSFNNPSMLISGPRTARASLFFAAEASAF